MIKLTRTDGQVVAINESFIEQINQTPDTFISLSNGKTLVVQESLDDVCDLIIEYKKACYPSKIEKQAKATKTKTKMHSEE